MVLAFGMYMCKCETQTAVLQQQWLGGQLRGLRSKLMKNNLTEFQAPEMAPGDRQFLTQIYKEDAKALETLLGQEFDWFK